MRVLTVDTPQNLMRTYICTLLYSLYAYIKFIHSDDFLTDSAKAEETYLRLLKLSYEEGENISDRAVLSRVAA